MRHLRVFVRRLAGLFRKARRDRELAEEIESNLQMHIADNLLAGMSAEEARRQAQIRFGGVEAAKEAYRDRRGLPALDAIPQDVRYGLRALRRNPGFALTAVLTLALGIGAATAIFSAMYALLVRPLPYRDSGRLVWVTERWRGGGGGTGAIAEPDMIAWRERGRPFEAVAAYAIDDYTLTGAGGAARIPGALVSANFLSFLGVAPQIGRDLVAADDRPGSPAVALLSNALWRERFRGDPRVVGTTLNIDANAYVVVGVLPARFRFPGMANAPQVLIALRASGSSAFNLDKPIMTVQVLARVRPRDSLANAEAELQSFQETRRRLYPGPMARLAQGRKLEIVPLQRHLAGDSRRPLMVLLAAVGFVLLIACANIANLQLVRAEARRHEVAVRSALGGTRMRLARQVLTESLMISALATIAGLAVGAMAIHAIRRWQSPALPWLGSVSLDPFVLGVAIGVAIVAAVLFGAVPAIAGSRANLMDAMKTTSHCTSEAYEHRLARNALVAGEVALALVLLIAASLLVRSFRGLMSTDPGYDPRNVLTAKLQLPLEEIPAPAAKSGDDRKIIAFSSELLPELNRLPGVKYSALTSQLPLDPYHFATVVWFGPTAPPREMWPNLRAPVISATPNFFRAMGTTIVQGRAFEEGDNGRSPGVAIVNRAFAQRFCSGNALGKRFHSFVAGKCAGCMPGEPAALEVVGIAADVRQQGLDHPAEPQVYLPFAQAPEAAFNVVIATDRNPGPLSAPLRSIVFALNRHTPVYDIATLERRLSESLARRRLTMFLLTAFAALALLLAAIGVYGVISYSVVRRTREIGIRVALGATRGSVLRLILGQQARMILLGGSAGLAVAYALSGVMSSLLYGVKPHDFPSFAWGWFILTTIALLAGVGAARRATRTDPSVALRYE